MTLSKIKLVVSDLDGTLLNQNGEISTRFFQQFQELQKQNIHFVAASGRQYQSITHKLESIKDKISIIAENGSLVKFNNETKVLFELSKKELVRTIEILRKIKGCHIVLCGRNAAYIESKNEDFVSKFSEYYAISKNVEDLTTVINKDAFLKVAVFHFESSEGFILPHLNEIESELKVVVSGQNWLDISHPDVNKGHALGLLQKELNITEEETMIFGDYNNDLQMLKLGHFSYAMENAHPNVKKIARFKTKSNSEEGVETILEQLLSEF